uniref:Melanotransferrin 2 n=1 Tax=Hemiscolopendra marginata TaxID=943146 RepID=A0A646QDM4_9MYRI
MSARIFFLWLAGLAFAAAAPTDNILPARFCTISDEEDAKCQAMKTNFADRSLTPGIECIRGVDKYSCMQMIEEREADLLSCWSMDGYVAGKYHHLIPLLQEKHTTEPGWSYAYYAMAVVRKDDDSIHSLEDLRGKRSCHTGINRHVGWAYPVSQLNRRGLLQGGSCVNNIANVANFFNKSCVSGAKNPIWDPKGEYSNLCALCGGQGDTFCSASDPYASYTGSLKCILDGRGDVAFIKDTTFGEVIAERPEVANQKENYELLCLDGTRKPVDSFKECNWGTIPERVLMTSPQLSESQKTAIRNMFSLAQQDQEAFKLFDSSAYNGRHLLFHDNTKSLEDVGDKNDYEKYLGDYMQVKNHQFVCQVPAIRWCTISTVETKKCYRMRDALTARFVKPDVECVQANNTNECMQLIKENKADVIDLDGGDIYKGGKEYDLQVIMNENLVNGDAKYWGVAVVKKANADITYQTLKGKKSCHTAIGRSAGWNIPVGSLLSSGQITTPPDCNIAEAVGGFFNASCAPGALSAQFNPSGQNPQSLCSLCAGTGDNKCARNENEPFFGYTGAFKCMATGVGDVAFVKHVTPIDNTDGHNEDSWAKDLHLSDFELLCKDGSRKSPNDYETCNLAKVPSHAIVTQETKDAAEINRIEYLLDLGQFYYGEKKPNNFHLFSSGQGSKDLLFSDSTKSIKSVPEERRQYRKYLGDIADVYDKINDQGCQH